MENMGEWLNLLVRWFHIIAGISWIGSSFYFMWLDSALDAVSEDSKILGTVWMVHGGGFYKVEKRQLAPGELPQTLHWFKWEALLTWVSGVFLLGIVYYWGGLMEETQYLSPVGFAAVGALIIVLTWFVYDALWVTALPSWVSTVLSFGLVVGVSILGAHYLGARASFIHVGAAMGTMMVANVWLRILPAQRQLIDSTKRGRPLDLKLAARAKMRSVHNNYMTFPVVFIMISSHFPNTYGHSHNWLVLALLIVASAAVRHHLNTHRHRWMLAVASAVIIFLIYFTR